MTQLRPMSSGTSSSGPSVSHFTSFGFHRFVFTDRQIDALLSFPPLPAGKIILPGNLISLTYFGRSCGLMVETIKGEDGVTLQRAPLPLVPDTEESSVLESTSGDLSLQFGSLTIDNDDADGAPSTPGGPDPAASTPHRPAAPPRLFSPPSSCSSPNPAADSAEEAVSPEVSTSSEPAEKAATAPSGGRQCCDTFYTLCSTTKVTFKDKRAAGGSAKSKRSKVTYSMIGGLSSQLGVIRETIELPLKHPELFSNYGRSHGTAPP